MTLSIVIASYNDNDQLAATVASIRATAPGEVEIVVVDDCSVRPINFIPNIKLARNPRRIGCGPSRFVGAMKASGEYLLICDSHMRFTPGWYEAAMAKLRPKVLHCGRCLGLGVDMNVDTSAGVYSGATWNFCGPDQAFPRIHQVFECVWAPEQAGDDYEIAAVMGACYFLEREWFIQMNPLRHLHLWGGDEQELSLKAWLSGGEIRLLKSVRIGHLFRQGQVSNSFVMPHHVMYNKLFVMHACLPPEMATRLQNKMQRGLQYGIALKNLRDDWHLVETERAYNERIFQRSFQWLLDRFKLPFPS